MNQFVAPTNFITDTSRRREKMAMRIVLRINTRAEKNNTPASAKKMICITRMTLFISRICLLGAVTS